MKIINGELEIIQKRIQKYKDTIKELNFIKDYIIKNASHKLNDDKDFQLDKYEKCLWIYTDENYYYVNDNPIEDFLNKHCIIQSESDKYIIIEGLKDKQI